MFRVFFFEKYYANHRIVPLYAHNYFPCIKHRAGYQQRPEAGSKKDQIR